MITIEEIETVDQYFSILPFIYGIEYVNVSPNIILARCICGDYECCIIKKENELVGALITAYNKDVATVIGLYLRKNLSGNLDIILDRYRDMGVKKLNAVSTHDEEFFKGFSSFNRKWSYYEKEL